ncbi:hypothetical protein C2S53_018040 [Perilla frutescens var. hirtella]|uniref:Transposase MuDR plant domain-containing protein n=1 Tax=Perilla frutescens var. hirtella TaxID=608512 RepID=A0AAD4J7L3_PERFH|nr:hypothetical protein C2S53_018040 [Perilla frutescens var. hirtella]
MVRHRIIVRHSGRWERAQYVDGVEEQVIMSSDGFCFRSLIREIHELLKTDPTSVEYQLSWMSSTNSGRQIKTRLKDDADLLDLLHEQSSEMVVYVVQKGCSSSRVIPDTVPEERDPIRSTGGRRRLMGMMGEATSSNTRSEDVPERALSNWVVPLANLDIAGPLNWGDPSAAHTDTLYKGAIFRTNDDLALTVGLYLMQNRVEYVVYRSNKKRLVYMCKHGRECPFRLCDVVDGVVWRIYKFNTTHTSHMDMSRIAPRQVPARVIAKHFARKLVDEGVVLKPKEMMSELLREYMIQINYSFTLRSRNIAIEMIYGDYDKSAFQEGSRPVVVIDGTHLKGRNKGILFVAATKDGNEQILPIAIGLDVFQRHMSALELVSTPAYQKLCRIGPEHWSRSQCPARRFSFMTSNAAESLNARLLAAAQSWDHVLTPEAVNKLLKNVEHVRCFPIRCTTLAHLWKVEVGRESFMVDLQHRTYDCGEFELDLIPCSHATAAIRFSGGHIYDFVDRCYKTETVVSIYDSVIMGLLSSEKWILSPYGSPLVLAPMIKKQDGRPRMSGARGGVEASSSL